MLGPVHAWPPLPLPWQVGCHENGAARPPTKHCYTLPPLTHSAAAPQIAVASAAAAPAVDEVLSSKAYDDAAITVEVR